VHAFTGKLNLPVDIHDCWIGKCKYEPLLYALCVYDNVQELFGISSDSTN